MLPFFLYSNFSLPTARTINSLIWSIERCWMLTNHDFLEAFNHEPARCVVFCISLLLCYFLGQVSIIMYKVFENVSKVFQFVILIIQADDDKSCFLSVAIFFNKTNVACCNFPSYKSIYIHKSSFWVQKCIFMTYKLDLQGNITAILSQHNNYLIKRFMTPVWWRIDQRTAFLYVLPQVSVEVIGLSF